MTDVATNKLVPKKIKKKLKNYKFEVEIIVLGGRVKNFPISFAGYIEEIPIIRYGDLAKLVVDYYHKKVHKEVDSVIAHLRQDGSVVKCRKIAAAKKRDNYFPHR